MDKLMKDLDFIDQPLAPKRIRKNKENEKSSTTELSKESTFEKTLSEEEEKRRRKNKD